MPLDEVSLILRALDQAFDHRSWHGTNLRGSIRGLDPKSAAWKPAPDRHSIQELTLHCAYWKYAVRRRITGEKRGSFVLPGSNFFQSTAADWKRDVSILASEHKLLREVVSGLNVSDLDLVRGGSRFNVRDLVLGVAAHDLYHAGQIQLLKRLCAR